MNTENAEMSAPVQPIVIPPMSPYFEQDGITIYNADCRQVLPFLGMFDLLLTDPPYGLGDKWKSGGWIGAKNGDGRLWNASGGDWDAESPPAWLIEQAVSHASDSIIWGGNYFGLPPSRGVLTWDKVHKHSGSDFEYAWTTLDKPAKTFRMSRIDAYKNKAMFKKVHPAEKPIQLMQWCIEKVGGDIVDPFAGVGGTLVAAKLAGRRAVGIEVKQEYCEEAVKRIQSV